ncbi:hypothetical protein [Chryseobacterium indoltheticum]|jgi:hypothetical protein|uniref:Uncharacterized protein n=1 Tax=Chryseobacterium indoltheticum TaxID=254 RepID=A0A376C2Q3_9FLAO|nr:hypothetical protein [Chryseobacterium indoltheticum]STA63126.1 Uncharacterised protein [Chryseobacterium indoltheticum]
MEIPSYFTYIQGLFGLITAYILIKTRKNKQENKQNNQEGNTITTKHRMIAAILTILSLIIIVSLIMKFNLQIGNIFYYLYYSLMVAWFISIVYMFSTRKVI